MDIIILHNFFFMCRSIVIFFHKGPANEVPGWEGKKITTHNISPIDDSAFRWPRFFFIVLIVKIPYFLKKFFISSFLLIHITICNISTIIFALFI